MNEILLEVIKAQQLTAWAVVFTAALTFLGVVITAVVLYVTRETRRDVRSTSEILREVSEISREIHNRAERLNYYLSSKLGPLDTK